MSARLATYNCFESKEMNSWSGERSGATAQIPLHSDAQVAECAQGLPDAV